MDTLRTETTDGVRSIILTRAAEYNTITPELRAELSIAIDQAGIARHTQEGLDFVTRAQEAGFRQAVRERDDPFGDDGSRPRP